MRRGPAYQPGGDTGALGLLYSKDILELINCVRLSINILYNIFIKIGLSLIKLCIISNSKILTFNSSSKIGFYWIIMKINRTKSLELPSHTISINVPI